MQTESRAKGVCVGEGGIYFFQGGGIVSSGSASGEFSSGDVSLIGERQRRVTRRQRVANQKHICNPHTSTTHHHHPPISIPPLNTPTQSGIRISRHGRRYGSCPPLPSEPRSVRRENRRRRERRREAWLHHRRRPHRHHQVEAEREEPTATRKKEAKEDTVVAGEQRGH